MGVGDDVRAGNVELLGTALVLGPAEIGRRQAAPMQIRPVRPPDNEDPLRKRVKQQLGSIFVAHWTAMVANQRLEAGVWRLPVEDDERHGDSTVIEPVICGWTGH